MASCTHDRLRYEERACEMDPETGYIDGGSRHTCLDCGAVFEGDELAAEYAAIEREMETISR